MDVVASQLEYSGGNRRDRSELILDAGQLMSPAAIQKKGSLYLILEPDNAAFPISQETLELARSLQQIVVQDYYNNPSTTVTSALRAAIEKANQFLLNRNSKLPPPERGGFGLSCAVLRQNEFYLAQMPPTQAILVHQGQLKYFPTPSDRAPGPRPVAAATPADTLPLPNAANRITTSQPRRSAQPSLGRYTSIEPNLLRSILEVGDVLIFVSTELVHALRGEQTERIFLKEDGKAALYSLSDWMRTEHIANGYSLAISALSDYASTRQNHSQPRRGQPTRHFEPPAAAQDSPATYDYDDNADETAAPIPGPLAAPTTVNKIVAQPQPVPTGDPELMAVFDEPEQEPWLRREQDELQQPPYLRGRNPNPDPAPPPNLATAENAPTAPFSSQPISPAPVREREFTFTTDSPPASEFSHQSPPLSSKSTARAGQAAVRLDYEPVASQPYFDRANGYDQPHAGVAGRNRPRSRANFSLWPFLLQYRFLLMAGVAVLLVLVAAFVLLGNASQTSQRQTAAVNYVQQAEASRESADQLALSDPTRARTLIEQARTTLDKAKTEQPDNPNIAPEQTRLQQTLDKINRVSVPPDLHLTFDATSLGAGVKIAQGVLTDDGTLLFLLDKGRGSVYQLDANGAGQPKTILKPGDKASGRDFGKPLAMSNRLDSIVVLDDKNTAWVYNRATSAWSATVLGGAAGWTNPVRQIATYDGNLYIVGPGNNQILRYSSGGYQGNPDQWLDPAVLDQVNIDRTAAFGIDGQIYALTNDGKLMIMARKSGQAKGQISQQAQAGGNLLSPALNGPLSINPANFDYPYYFMIDGEKRVLQFKKEDSSLVQQYRAAVGNTEFDKLRDVAVDTKNNKLYAIGEQQIYSFSLAQPDSGGTAVVTVGFQGATSTPTK